jgi:TRAP-type C4-dicarboxylate transport system permease small subunit
MKTLDRIQKFLASIGAVVSAALIFGMMALICVDVAGRYLGKAVTGSYEIVMMVMALIVFYALPYAQFKKGLVRVDFIINFFPKLPRKILWAFGDLIATVVCYLLAIACYLYASQTLLHSGQRTSVLLLPYYPFYFAAAAGLLLFALILTVDLLHSCLHVFREEEGALSGLDAEIEEAQRQP